MKRFELILMLMTGLALAGLVACSDGQKETGQETDDEENGEREVLYWVAPMDSSYRRDEPGQSPMGMDLVPVYADEVESEPGVVRVEPAMVQNMNLRLGEAVRETLDRTLHTFGAVEYNEEGIGQVHTRVDGWIEDLRVRAVGERVAEGDVLFEIYSPELVNAQEEFLQILRRGDARTIASVRERLRSLGVDSEEIAALEESRRVSRQVKIRARQSGVVTDLTVREGMHVTPGTRLMTVADLSTVWVIADLFEKQVGRVRPGDAATVSLPMAPGETWTGEVDFIYPELDRRTRTVPVRLRLDNSDGRFRPGMYAGVAIHAETREDVLVVPREAVIRTGRNDRVFVHLGDGRFRLTEVEIGAVTDERIEIREGLSEGDEVVVSGQFLLDSETSVAAVASATEADEESDDSEMANDHAGHGGMGDDEAPHDETSGDEPVTGMGTVESIEADEQRLRLAHEPIPALDWPAMTMDFPVADDVDLSGLEAGDRVHFRLSPPANGDGMHVISRIGRHE